MFSRHDWIQKSTFHPITEEQVLRKVSEDVSTSLSQGKTPTVILDLDSTLYEVAPRTHRIISDWLGEKDLVIPESCRNRLKILAHHEIGYSLKDTFEQIGLSLEHPETLSAWENLKTFWWDRFFTNEYLPHDKVYDGAVSFAQEVYDKGAQIIYLTGREEGRMLKGTIENLQRDRFPWGTSRTHLIMRQGDLVDDLTHKKDRAKEIARQSEVIASFENEPANLVALMGAFPQAHHVFMHTVCSDHPAPAAEGIFKLTGFSSHVRQQ